MSSRDTTYVQSDLPLKIRVGVRDQWDSPRAPIASSIDALGKTLGYTIAPQINWPTLYAMLKDTFVEQGMFVSAICRIGIAFYGRMLSRIEDAAMADWTDSLLDGMAKREGWVLRIEGSDNASLQRPQLTWNEDYGFFKIDIPNRKPPGNSIIEAGFDEDLDALFSLPVYNPPSGPLPSLPSPPVIIIDSADNDWTDVTDAADPTSPPPPPPPDKILDSVASTANATKRPDPPANKSQQPTAKRPQSYGLPRPNKLFAGTSVNPVMTIDAGGGKLVIHCSHEATLQQLGTYLVRWARIDNSDSLKRPMLKLEMIESAFFDDVMDTMTVTPSWSRGASEPLNPTFILSFVEGILGYKQEFTNGTRWIFKLYPVQI